MLSEVIILILTIIKRSEIIMNKIETILHPIRFKIIQRFLDGQNKTAKILAKELKDIPQATLYRQLDALVKSEVLIITEENQIRGTLEKVYSLNVSSVSMTNKDINELSKEEHLQYFLFFVAQLSKDFESYLQKGDVDFERDGIGYRQIALHMTDEEFMEFLKDMGKVYEKYAKNAPTPNRIKRSFSNIVIPDYEGGNENE
jgi:DNA-binding HxlR family transcriptional regulator